jgi:pimeloyl-ACP methyl ester carboxylesterase
MKKTCFAALLLLSFGVAATNAGSSETGYVDVGKTKLYYEESGRGQPLIMIHGGLLNHRMWDDQFEEFAKHYRVIRYDARGHGLSPAVPDTFGHHVDLRRLITGLGIEKPIILGLSMGGYIAIDFALKYPDHVAALVLVGPGLTGYEFKSEEFLEVQEQLMQAVREEDPDRIVECFQRGWTDGPRRTPEEIDPAVREKVRRMAIENVRNWTEGGVEYRLAPAAIERLAEITAPTLAIVGDLDMPGILEIVDKIERDAVHAKKVVIKGAAHMVNMEKPEEFNRVVLAFLSTIGARTMKYIRVYADDEGESHFEDVEIELSSVDFAPPAPPLELSALTDVSKFGILRAPAGWAGDWHPAPKKQWIIYLSGEIEAEVSDGEIRRAGPGTITLAEDTWGKGHRSKVVSPEGAVAVVVQIED